MDWPAIVTLAADEIDISPTLTGLERQLALALFSSLSEADFVTVMTDSERDLFEATRASVIDKLS